MALTIGDVLRTVIPNIGLAANPDGSYRIGVEDVNSDEILAAVEGSETDIGFIRDIPVKTPYTGTGVAIGTLNPGADFQLMGIRLHLGSALAAAETLTVTLDALAGGAYDVVLYTLDLGTPDIRDVVIPFGGKEDYFVSGDQIVIALSANVGGDTFGCEVTHQLS